MDGLSTGRDLTSGHIPPTVALPEWRSELGYVDPRHMYCPPYPPPPYSAAPYPAMAYPPPYSAAQCGLPPYPADKLGPPDGRHFGEGRLDPGSHHQALVCTCHPAVPPPPPPPVAADDDGLLAARCSCPPTQSDRRRRSGSRGSNFSEDSLAGGEAAAPVPEARPVVLRPGGGAGARSPQKRRSLTQEYLAQQADSRRNSHLLVEEGGAALPLTTGGDTSPADGDFTAAPTPVIGGDLSSGEPPSAEDRQSDNGRPPDDMARLTGTPPERDRVDPEPQEQPPAAVSSTVEVRRPTLPADEGRRRSLVYEERAAALSQCYNEPMVSVLPETRRLSQLCSTPPSDGCRSPAYDDRPAPEPQRLSQAYMDHAAMSHRYPHEAPEHRRSAATYDERPGFSEPHRLSQSPGDLAAVAEDRTLSQAYEDRPATAENRRMSQSYDDRLAVAENRRLSQSYDDTTTVVDNRRLSQSFEGKPPVSESRFLPHSYDDRPAVSESRRLSQNYDDRPAVSDNRRLSQNYDDRSAVSESRRLSQNYDDRPAVAESRRLSQNYDDRPAVSDNRRLSQNYDDRPAVSENRRLSQNYDDRPAVSENRRLSQNYDDRPAVSESRRLSQSYDDRPAVAESRRLSQSQSYSGVFPTHSVPGEEDQTDAKPACQKYDERPCTAAADTAGPAAATVKPWWEKQPDRRTPAKTKPKDSPSRRPSVDRSARGTTPRAASPDRAAAGDADDSPVAFTVDLGPPAVGAGRKLHVKDSISRWAPRYRRSLSGAHKDDETRSDSGEMAAAGPAVPRPRSMLRRRAPGHGYHSEGYFSSDQDNDARERRLPGRGGDSAQSRPPASARTPSPRRSAAAARLSAARRATVTRAPTTAGGLKKSATMGALPAPVAARHQQQQQQAPPEDAADDVSEAGTYTIENEPEPEAAPQGDAAFPSLEPYATTSASGERRNSGGESSSHEASPDRDATPATQSAAYGTGANWIEQWAAEVTKHNQQNLRKTAQQTTGTGTSEKPPTAGSCSPWSRHTLSPDGGRPRRKLPTPPAPAAARERPGALASSLDTESYLRTTEDVVSALQARLDASTATGEDSDSVSSDSSDRPPAAAARPPAAASRPAAPAPATTGVDFKFNRALSLRRARLGLDDGTGGRARPSPSPSAARAGSTSSRKHSDSESGAPPPPPAANSAKKGANFARSDGGRFSLRMANGTAKAPVSRVPTAASKKPAGAGGPGRTLGGGPRAAAAAAQATRDQEMANWKRRKNYDPLKAAKEAKRKQQEPGVGGSQSDSACGTAAPLRSASFHGTDGLGAALLRRRRGLHQSEDESATSANAAAAADRHRSPAPPGDDSDLSEVFHDDVSAAVSTRKVSLDGSRRSSPLFRGQASSSLRNKALDNLVISTIHTLSTKIRGDSESLVSKLKCQFEEEDVRHTLLDDILTTLGTDTPSASKASSRDLAGILKNLRKVEQAVQVLEQVLCDDEDELSDGDDPVVGDKFGDGFY